jgi:hypothetical protein
VGPPLSATQRCGVGNPLDADKLRMGGSAVAPGRTEVSLSPRTHLPMEMMLACHPAVEMALWTRDMVSSVTWGP